MLSYIRCHIKHLWLQYSLHQGPLTLSELLIFLLGEPMKPTEHSIFDSVKVGVFNGHFITAFKYFGVIVDAKKQLNM